MAQLWWNNAEIVNYFQRKPADPRIVRRLQSVSAREQKKALDLGCGGGRHTQVLCQLGFDWYACDIQPSMIKATRQRLAQYASLPLVYQKVTYGTMGSLPYKNNTFDVVVTTGVLHQAPNYHAYERAVSELSRVAKPGAIICLNIFTNAVLDKRYQFVDTYTVVTPENLYMTLLPKTVFYKLMSQYHLYLEEEFSEDQVLENTGPRAVLRAHFLKRLP